MITDQAIGKTGLRLESDPMSMHRSHQITSGMSLLLGYDSGARSFTALRNEHRPAPSRLQAPHHGAAGSPGRVGLDH